MGRDVMGVRGNMLSFVLFVINGMHDLWVINGLAQALVSEPPKTDLQSKGGGSAGHCISTALLTRAAICHHL